MPILLRNVTVSNLPIFFEQQFGPEATAMAAFPSREQKAFDAHWVKIISNESIILRTIEMDGQVAGHLASFFD